MIGLLALLACRPDPVPEAPAEPTVPLDDLRLARRLSLDIRGVLPTVAELESADADPAALDALQQAWFDDPRHEQRLVDVFTGAWHTRIDEFHVTNDNLGVSGPDAWDLVKSIGEEPARLMAYVATHDRPWSETVTADYTVADEPLLEHWPLESLEDTAGWRPARYTDGRPAGGVLMTNGLWWRYTTTPSSRNRGRAAALASHLLCYDFLSRPVEQRGIPDFTDAGLLDATKTNEACIACHSGLDPLAATLFGFWPYEGRDPNENASYHPTREALGARMLGVEPAYFGTPVLAVSQLGPLVADDPRFRRCAVETAAQSFWQRDVDTADTRALDAADAAFLASGDRYPALMKAILATPEYRAGGFTALATDADRERVRTTRLMSPEQLSTVIYDLTGYTWSLDGWDQLLNDAGGYRVLAGGMDHYFITRPTPLPTVTHALAMDRIAQAAAERVVAFDLAAAAGERRLLPGDADLAAVVPGTPSFRAAVRGLHLRLHGVDPDDERIVEVEGLWAAVAAESDAEQAWRSLLTVLIRDPDFWSY